MSEKVANNNWGDKIVNNLSEFIKSKYSTLKGFSRRGIYRMRQFYELYKDDEIVSPLVTQLSWSNNILIMSGTKTREQREFYIKMTIKNHYSKAELNRQLDSGYYERYMLSDRKAKMSLQKTVDEDDFPNTKILDTYVLEFLDLPSNYLEKENRKIIYFCW